MAVNRIPVSAKGHFCGTGVLLPYLLRPVQHRNGKGDSEQAEVRSLIRRNGSPPLVEFDGSTDSSFAGYKMKGKVERERRYKKWIKPVRED